MKKTRNYNGIVVKESQLKIGFGCFRGFLCSSGLKLIFCLFVSVCEMDVFL